MSAIPATHTHQRHILSADSPRHRIWLSRLRVALRWFWPLDLAILALNAVARACTWWLLAPRPRPIAVELSPLAAWLMATWGLAGATIGTGAAVTAIWLCWQMWCVAHSRLGKRVGLITTVALLALVATDAAWDLTQVFAGR